VCDVVSAGPAWLAVCRGLENCSIMNHPDIRVGYPDIMYVGHWMIDLLPFHIVFSRSLCG
jgi:hypothetical protein